MRPARARGRTAGRRAPASRAAVLQSPLRSSTAPWRPSRSRRRRTPYTPLRRCFPPGRTLRMRWRRTWSRSSGSRGDERLLSVSASLTPPVLEVGNRESAGTIARRRGKNSLPRSGQASEWRIRARMRALSLRGHIIDLTCVKFDARQQDAGGPTHRSTSMMRRIRRRSSAPSGAAGARRRRRT